MAAANSARVDPVLTVAVFAVAVIAVAFLKVFQKMGRIRQGARIARPGGQSQAYIIAPAQLAQIIGRQIAHDRHPVILDLPITQRPFPVGKVQHHRLQQIFPMRGQTRRAVLAGEAEEFLPILVIGRRQGFPIRRQPFNLAETASGLTVRLPVRRIGAAKAEQRVLRLFQTQILGINLHHQNGDVEIEEEIQIDMGDVEQDRRIAPVERHPRLGDVGAAEHLDRRLSVTHIIAGAASAAFAVEKPLHIRQKGDELGVMPLLKFTRVAGKLIGQLYPGIVRGQLQQFPVLLDLRTLERHQLQRPEQDLPKMADLIGLAFFAMAHGTASRSSYRR